MHNNLIRGLCAFGQILLAIILLGPTVASGSSHAEHSGKVAVIGTGFMGGAIVVKAFNTLGYFLIADPSAIDEPITVPIASDDRAAKEKVASIVVDMGLDAVDSGPLRFSHELEGMAMIYMMPLDQRRRESWEFSFRRTNHWAEIWEDDWSEPVHDADDLATIPELGK